MNRRKWKVDAGFELGKLRVRLFVSPADLTPNITTSDGEVKIDFAIVSVVARWR